MDNTYISIVSFLREFFSSEDVAPKALTGESSGRKSRKRKVFY